MRLSIIVPVFNMAADGKLEYCMNSLVNQTISNYEIIAVDDASTDNSLEILNGFAKRYPEKVKVIHYEVNKRQGGAKNEGLKAACGEWIGFIDSDDWVTEDYYEKLLQRAEETGADMVGCDYNLVDRHTMEVGRIVQNNSLEQTGILDEEKHKKLLMRSGSMVIKIYKHQVIRENQLHFPEGIFYEDNCAGPLWSLYFTHFEKVEEPMYYYYQHQVSTVHYISEAKCQDRMKAAVLLYEECKKRGFLEKYFHEIEYRFTELYYAITLFSYMSGVKHPKLGFVKELRRGVMERFPDFEKNVYYQRETGEEEKALIAMQGRSDVRFFGYYRLKLLVRRLRNASCEHKQNVDGTR
ncbi:MAG: glycosyltransferase [Lachnospiraceae bacterium]|nr:glycosyltransferase [Lachnospiraceae bacterium]